jgi:hypothetical protein
MSTQAASAGATGSGAPPPPVPVDGQAPGAAAPPLPAGYRPEGLPDHLAGPDDKTTIDQLWKATKGFRDAEATRDAPPKEAAAYTLGDFSEESKVWAADLAKDELFGKVKEVALKAGIPAKAFATFVPGVFDAFVKAGALETPIDYEAEKNKLVPIASQHLDENGKAAAVSARVEANIAFLKAMQTRGLEQPAAELLLAALPDSYAGNVAIEWFRKQLQEVTPATAAGVSPGQVGEQDFDRHLSKPESDQNHPMHKHWQLERTALAKKIWGDSPVG